MNNTHNRQLERQRRHRRSVLLGAIAALAIVGIAALAITRAASGGSASGNAAAATGETNSMGMPVIATPGNPNGTATAAGITAQPATWALGKVPLNVAVRPNWTITNTGNDTITLGEPEVQINQGCCPGALTYQGTNVLTPGDTTRLSFELSMHPGMDGAHDMTLHVPVNHADGTSDILDLTVTGDFRN
ncbi:MAG: hypothetical protein HY826_07600 [Actinobacteria bacterium]|nr:hypothetical protein [Actinomycetota bacterium]